MLRSFARDHLKQDAERSGLLQCLQRGLVWLAGNNVGPCPEGDLVQNLIGHFHILGHSLRQSMPARTR
jgi:hypothetical protein